MGNKLARLNFTPSKTFGTKEVDQIWHLYDPKNKGYLTQEEARKVTISFRFAHPTFASSSSRTSLRLRACRTIRRRLMSSLSSGAKVRPVLLAAVFFTIALSLSYP